MVLFGLTWLFWVMTVREASIVFQFLFVISNAFQGFFFFVFIIYVYLVKKAANFGLACLGRIPSHIPSGPLKTNLA